MDNLEQMAEIVKYQSRLAGIIGKDIPLQLAAWIWIKKYARLWRLRHPPVCAAKETVSQPQPSTPRVLSAPLPSR